VTPRERTHRTRRLPALVLTLAIAALVTVVLPAAPAAACSCKASSTAEQYQRADAVFTGTLVSRTEGQKVDASFPPATYLFTVDEVLKGEVLDRQPVISAWIGASCGLEIGSTGPFAVFAREKQGHLWASLCGGTATLTPELQYRVDLLSGRLDPVPDGGWWPARLSTVAEAVLRAVLAWIPSA
jgi:hypothetical protein